MKAILHPKIILRTPSSFAGANTCSKPGQSIGTRLIGAVCTTLAASFVVGCSTAPLPVGLETAPNDERRALEECLEAFADSDAMTKAAGVRDAQDSTISGFPYLRVNRHLASFRAELPTPHATAVWLNRMRDRDLEARHIEAANRQSVRAMSPQPDQTLARLEACGQRMIAFDLTQPARIAAIRANATVTDNYSMVHRTAGLYPISSLGVAAGVARWESSTIARFAETPVFPQDTETLVVTPAEATGGDFFIGSPLRDTNSDTLGIIELSAADETTLLARHMPGFVVAQRGLWDIPGTIVIDEAGQPAIDTTRTSVYTRITHTRYGTRSLVQLVYTLWFRERPPTGTADIYAGFLDGITVRITLDTEGRPAVVDSIHPCGCYHLFFAVGDTSLRLPPDTLAPFEEWRFVPGEVSGPQRDARLVVAVDSGTHYLSNVRFESNARPLLAAIERTARVGITTDREAHLLDENTLRRLPTGTGTKSLYGQEGLIAGTERGERFLLWPMGVVSAGAMRQWGHHATAFVGRRHFDDARLMEERFVIR